MFRSLAVLGFLLSLFLVIMGRSTLPAPVLSTSYTMGNTHIDLDWTTVSGATGYKVYRRVSGFTFLVADIPGVSWTDNSITNGTIHTYYVQAYNSTDGSPDSNWESVTPNIAAPSLTATPAKCSVDLSWGAVPGATSYTVYRWLGFWSSIASGVTGTTYTHSNLSNGTTYTYAVRASNSSGPGLFSSPADATVYLPAPTGVTATKNVSNVVTISWSPVAWADIYRIYRYTQSGGNNGYFDYHGYSNTTTYNAGTVPPGTTYYYYVVAYNNGGESPRSVEVSSTGTPYGGAKPPHEGACPFDPPSACELLPPCGGLPKTCGRQSGPAGGDPVNLANGTEIYAPESDIEAYNPNGPEAVFQRNFRSNQSRVGYSSPGLSVGWIHNYDVTIAPSSSTSAWDPLTLVYPNGAVETITPTLSGGSPTGAFSYTNGLPYYVTGTASGTTNQWTLIDVHWKDQTVWRFELHSTGVYALTKITDRMGKSLDVSWDSLRRITEVTDPVSSVDLLTFNYGTDGLLDRVNDAYSRKVTYATAFDNGLKVHTNRSMISASSNSSPTTRATYTYTRIGSRYYLQTITVPSPTGTGNETATIGYDSSSAKVTYLQDANGNKREYTYGSGTTTVTVKNSGGTTIQSWTQNYNGSNRNSGVTDSASKSSLIEYLDANNPAKPTRLLNPNNREALYTYDTKGNTTSMTDTRGVTTTYTWDYTNYFFGRLTSIQVAGKGATTISYFEPSGLVDTITSPLPGGNVGTASSSFTYDSLGNILTATVPGNGTVSSKTTTFNYTTDGMYSQSAAVDQPVTISDNLGNTTHLRYDSQGRAVQLWDALGNQTDYTFNLAGQVLTVTAPATGQTGVGRGYLENVYLYPGGLPVSRKSYNESGTLVRQNYSTYGKEGEPLSVTGDTENGTYTYDALYRLKSVTDGLSQTTNYTYNSRGFVSQIALPGGDTVQFTSYDDAGNILQRVDANSVTTNFEYNDDSDKLTDIKYPATPSRNVTFTYDGYGRTDTVTDQTGTIAYTYGDLDEILSVVTTYSGLAAKTISYDYHPDGKRSSMTTPAGTFTYTYDGAGRLSDLTNPFSETSSWTYLANNLLDTQEYGNGAVTSYTYNALRQLTDVETRNSSNTLLSSFGSATYDGIGNMKSITASIPGASSYSGLTSWNFDGKDQVTQEQSARMGGYTNTFGYDSAGNPTTFKGVSRSYNSRNQLTGAGLSYDANGNPTTYGGTTLTFDPENRMTAYGTAMTADYNALGQRAWKEASSVRTYFLYDGKNIVCELNASGTVTATDTWGANGLLSRRSGGASIFYTFDQRGATAQRLDSSQAVVTSNAFDAFGSAATTPADPHDGLGAQHGYYYDSETGLQLLTNRYYDASTGRFVTRDPAGPGGSFNLYANVGNNPVIFTDPLGLDRILIIVGDIESDEPWYFKIGDELTASYLEDLLTDEGHEVQVLLRPSMDKAIEWLKWADSVYLIGHGSRGGIRLCGSSLETDDKRADIRITPKLIASVRKGVKLKNAVVYACGQGNKKYRQDWEKATWSFKGTCYVIKPYDSVRKDDLEIQWGPLYKGVPAPTGTGITSSKTKPNK